MKSPKVSVKRSGKRKIKALRKPPLRRAHRGNSNDVIIDQICNKTKSPSRSPLKTVYTGSVAQNGFKNGCYDLSVSNKRKRGKKLEANPLSKRRKKIKLCETIVLSDDDDNHHNTIDNNDEQCNGNISRSDLSDNNGSSSTNSMQNSENPADNNDSKSGDEVYVVWSSTCNIPAQSETKLGQVDDYNGAKYFFDTIGNESNFSRQCLFPKDTVKFGYKKNEYSNSSSSNINNNNNGSNSVNILPSSQPKPENELMSAKLREIVVDGLNVTYGYTRKKIFSKEGIQLVLNYFRNRGHDVKIFLPQFERTRDREYLEDWYREGVVIFTPSRRIAGKIIISHDDRFILDYATKCKGIVVSSDQYRDLWKEKPEWRETIERRLLPPTFVGNYVMFPEDPLGRSGPRLDEFLRH